MALTKRSDSDVIYLEVKHYSLWRGLKQRVEGCDEVQTNNPSTGASVTKYGYKFDTVSGRAIKLEKYDTERKFSKRYFGFRLSLLDEGQTFVIDMPYTSQILRRFLRLAKNIYWNEPVSLTIFKGKKKEGVGFEDTGIWFRQDGETVKPFYTKEAPCGMPPATQDPHTEEWDFKAQHCWLVDKLQAETIPAIERAASHVAPPIEPVGKDEELENQVDESGPPGPYGITDDDVPF